MTIRLQNVEVPVSPVPQNLELPRSVAKALGIPVEHISFLNINKKSLDARRKARIVYHYQVDVDVLDEVQVLNRNASIAEVAAPLEPADPLAHIPISQLNFRHKPIIIGSGPAGIYAALTLVRAGQACTIIERGEPVEQRLRSVHNLRRKGAFTAESNYCFGEGGAGAFSDGKLSCGKNHPLIRHVFEEFVKHGAPRDILWDAKPHIGTDYLVRIAKNMRTYLESHGCNFVFGRRFVDFKSSQNATYEVLLDDDSSLPTDHVVIAIGHSARDTYEMLLARGLAIVPKPFAMGARFEHPQEVIDQIQFGACKLLPPAEYKLVAHAGARGIWTFCMCPGGHLLPTSAQPGHLAINGMSYHGRKSGYANAAVVVNVLREDFYRGHPLDGMRFQEQLERLAFTEGGGSYFSPAQKLSDFIVGRPTKGELKSTYRPGVANARLDKILPQFIVDALRQGVREYNQKMQGFIKDSAVVVGVESKTSSPISMVRSKNLQSISHPGIFPVGEGAGFAGGIVSAALDGVKVGRAVLESVLATQKAHVSQNS